MKVVARSCDALPGHPMSWVPTVVPPSPSHFPPWSDSGGPTSLNRGEGHLVGLSSVVESGLGQRGGDGGAMKEDDHELSHQQVINH